MRFAAYDKAGKATIVVTKGMLSLLHDDEPAWAGLLGHETAHLVKHHSEGRATAAAGAWAGGELVAIALSLLIPGFGGFVAGTAGGTAANKALYGAYTRPQEAEADQLGLQWLVSAGYDPHGMQRLFELLAKQSSGPTFLSTHPGAEDRAKMVRDYIDGK